MKKTLIVFAVPLSILWTAGVRAEFKEGLWKITTQMEIKGMPPATICQCITQNDPVPQTNDKNYNCKI
jgi:hypothetical protein